MPRFSRFSFFTFVLVVEFLFVFLKLLFLFLVGGNKIGRVKLLLLFRSGLRFLFLLLLKYLMEIGVVRRKSTMHKVIFPFLIFLFFPLPLIFLILFLLHKMLNCLLFFFFLFLLFFLPCDKLLKFYSLQSLFSCMVTLLIRRINLGYEGFFKIVGLLFWGLLC